MNGQQAIASSNSSGIQRGRKWWIGVTVAGFVVAVLFGANGPLGGFWGGDSSGDEIPAGALAGLVTAGLIEAVAFGVGLVWLAVTGLVPTTDRTTNRQMQTTAAS